MGISDIALFPLFYKIFTGVISNHIICWTVIPSSVSNAYLTENFNFSICELWNIENNISQNT